MTRLLASRRVSAAAVAILVLLVAGGGYAIASGGGTITVCVHRSTGVLYRAHTCAPHDRTLTWNARGPAGPPGPITGTLPHGVTLRGTYVINAPTTGGEVFSTAISFGLELTAAPKVHYIALGKSVPAGCSGTASAPGAASGNLCIFETENDNGNSSSTGELNPLDDTFNQATRFGAAVQTTSLATGAVNLKGSWAVTG
jgi:hypothetical protein